MTEQARLAIYAATHRRTWGRYATVRYCEKRGCAETIVDAGDPVVSCDVSVYLT